jgi:putative transposase
MKANRVESIYIKSSDIISDFCHRSKNLYNNANFTIRQELKESGKWLRYSDVERLMKEKEEFNDYYTMPVQSSQQTLKRLDKNWKGFFASMKAWKKNPEKFKSRPRPPKYLKKNGQTIITFTNQQCKIREGILKFPKMIDMEVKTRLPDDTDLREVRVVPMGTGYTVEIVYQVDIPDPKSKENRIGAIDLGLRNIIAFGDNTGGEPVIVKGGIAKSINQFYNKERSRIMSVYDRQNIKHGSRMKRLNQKRYWKIKDYFHKVSRKIIDICLSRDIDTLVIGLNKGWKQEIRLGKINNQNFVQIPFSDLIQYLKYKGEDVGIEVIINEEAYTSKCSFLDLEPVRHHDKYVGKRYRGLFRSSDGTKINADVNGLYNIMRKAIPEAFADGIEGLGVVPRRLSI